MSSLTIHKSLIPAAALLLIPSLAFAHPGHAEVNGFLTGALHPLTGMDHLTAMLAAGILAARLGRAALWAIPVAFLGLMAAGGGAGIAGIPLSFTEIGIALSVVVFGGLIAFDIKMPTALAAAGVGFFAIFHGYAHGIEMPLSASGVSYGAGFLTSTAILLGIGMAAAASVSAIGHRFGPSLVRMGGALASTAGLGFLATAIGG